MGGEEGRTYARIEPAHITITVEKQVSGGNGDPDVGAHGTLSTRYRCISDDREYNDGEPTYQRR